MLNKNGNSKHLILFLILEENFRFFTIENVTFIMLYSLYAHFVECCEF